MTLDLFLLLLVAVTAILGGLSGAAKQVAYWVGLVIAWVAARGLGPFAGPMFAKSASVPLSIGTIGATFAIFIVVLVVARHAVKVLLRRILAGRDPENRTADRLLGFVLGGAKTAVLAYVVLSALAFVEENVVVAGRRLGLSPRDSQAFALAREYNVFEATIFSPVKDFVKVANAATDPKKAQALAKDPAYQSLLKDTRFASALKTDGMKKALQSGDHRALLRNAFVLQLIQDPVARKRLAAVAAKQ